MAKKKPTPSDILDWIVTCIGEVEADSYQQSEENEDRWRKAGPPEIVDASVGKDQMFATLEGETFLIKVRRLIKPRKLAT